MRQRRVAAAVAVVLVVGGLTTFFVVRHDHAVAAAHRSQLEAEKVVTTYLGALSKGDVAAAVAVVQPDQRANAQAVLSAMDKQLDVASATYRATGPVLSTGKTPGTFFAAEIAGRWVCRCGSDCRRAKKAAWRRTLMIVRRSRWSSGR